MKMFFILLCSLFFACAASVPSSMNIKTIRYVALGDSYTICEGAKTSESWPVLLVNHLKADSISIALVANPSQTGYTTQNLIDNELPVFDTSDADFVTLCIGVNDWVRGVSAKKFKSNLNQILNQLQKKLKIKTNIILLTIPDFSVTPQGTRYTGGRDAHKGISGFNEIIKKEAEIRKLKLVDLFPVSKQMKDDKTLIAADGLHPSAKEYAIWEKMIYPLAKEVLVEHK